MKIWIDWLLELFAARKMFLIELFLPWKQDERVTIERIRIRWKGIRCWWRIIGLVLVGGLVGWIIYLDITMWCSCASVILNWTTMRPANKKFVLKPNNFSKVLPRVKSGKKIILWSIFLKDLYPPYLKSELLKMSCLLPWSPKCIGSKYF